MLVPRNCSQFNWFVLRTKPKKENVVLAALQSRGLHAYCPKVLEPPAHRFAPRGPVALFPGYAFVFCNLRDHFRSVRYATGGAGLLQFGDLFAAVEEEFLSYLRSRENAAGVIQLPCVKKPMAKGTRVRVVSGPFRGYEGLVERYIPARERVQILLKTVAGDRPVELDTRMVKVG